MSNKRSKTYFHFLSSSLEFRFINDKNSSSVIRRLRFPGFSQLKTRLYQIHVRPMWCRFKNDCLFCWFDEMARRVCPPPPPGWTNGRILSLLKTEIRSARLMNPYRIVFGVYYADKTLSNAQSRLAIYHIRQYHSAFPSCKLC